MSKRRHRSDGRATPKGTRPRVSGQDSRHTDDDPQLMVEVARRLREDHPFAMLAEASSLYAALDPRGRDPLSREPTGAPGLDEIVDTFIDVDRLETSALLYVFAELTDDDLLRERLRRELARRSHAMPHWLTDLGAVRPYRAVEMVHILGDGDDIILGVSLPEGHELTFLLYIDHNLGTVAKDGFAIPEPIADVVALMREKTGNDPDTAWNDIDLADARARIVDAVEHGTRTFPPYETDSWPASRPLLEWLARLLPEGGRGYERPEWTDDALEDIARRFVDSPFSVGLGHDERGPELLDALLWFGSGYGPGDPLRWSPVAVELFLLDWVPRKIDASVKRLTTVPDLLRAFIRFAHAEKGIRPSLTALTLDAVDRWEPDYQGIVRAPRPQGPMALLAAVGAVDPDEPWELPGGDVSWATVMRETLENAVGGPEVLENLDTDPLTVEPFDWTGIPEAARGQVGEVLDLCERCCDELLDDEYRAACRRFLARVARSDPRVFRRASRSENLAAAACWVVGKANELFSVDGGPMFVKDLLAHFGIAKGSVSQRAQVLLRAGGFESNWYGSIDLGSPTFLVSTRRRRIIELRDHYGTTEDE